MIEVKPGLGFEGDHCHSGSFAYESLTLRSAHRGDTTYHPNQTRLVLESAALAGRRSHGEFAAWMTTILCPSVSLPMAGTLCWLRRRGGRRRC
jgi:hypothetical protein